MCIEVGDVAEYSLQLSGLRPFLVLAYFIGAATLSQCGEMSTGFRVECALSKSPLEIGCHLW